MTTSATSAKPVNYTAEQSAELETLYAAGKGESVDALAVRYGKTAKSIVAKLSRMGVYVKKAVTTKSGEPVTKKDDTADAIGKILKMTENDASSLAKCNKTALNMILAALVNSKPLEG